jgi:elongation factor P
MNTRPIRESLNPHPKLRAIFSHSGEGKSRLTGAGKRIESLVFCGGALSLTSAAVYEAPRVLKVQDIIVKVIASQIRKGNVVEVNDQLYVVLKAESFFPGKGTPTTQIDMRRLSDGVKTVQRYRTTEQVERAFIETKEHNYLYEDAHGYAFMNNESYEQVTVPADVIGDQSIYLAENMPCQISLYNGVPVGIELPARVVLEVTETEPVTKGQTASSSYKPATLSNGARTTVPPHITAGTRVVIMTEDGSYVERAKD